jgi:D-3-phosphoglycerate dehydrogenase
MIKDKKVLVNILARAGSTGVKDKNIADVGGNPVLWYSVTEALKSKYADAICVSTDSEKYAKVAEDAGVKVPFLRAAEYSTKSSTAADASKWTTLEYEKHSKEKYDYIVDFMNSNPFKIVDDLDRCIEILNENDNADTVVAVNRVWDGHPDRIKQIIDGELQDWPGTNEVLESLRQDLTPPAYIRCGSVYAMKRHVLIDEGNRRGKISIPYVMPDERVCNIDEPKDLLTAKSMMELRNKKMVKNKSSYDILAISKCDDLPSVKESLSSLGNVTYNFDLKQDDLKDTINDYEIVFVPTNLKFNKEVWTNESKIKVIATPSVGIEHIDVKFFREKGVKIISLKNKFELTKKIYSPAEIAFSHVLNLSRNIVSAINDVKSNNWFPNNHIGNELNGKVIGIVGMGAVGTIMSNYCKAFGMKVVCYDPYKNVHDSDIKQYNSLKELLSESDIVSVHVDLTESTRDMFTSQEFKCMKDTAIFVNTSRGEVVNSVDLLHALNTNEISSVGLDVLNGERYEEGRKSLVDYSKQSNRLIITPHLGGSTVEARLKRSNHICKLLSDWNTNEN